MAEERDFVVEKNKRGFDTILYEGYRYNKIKRVNQDQSTCWRCVKRNECNASITVDVNLTTIIRKSHHTCQADHLGNELFIKTNIVKREVCKNLGPIKRIFEDIFDGINDASAGPSRLPTFHDKKDCFYNARKRYLGADRLSFNKLEDVVIPEALSENFLVAEDGTEEKILIFMTKLSKKVMRKARLWFGDGTFKSVPRPFYQLFTLHMDLNSDKNTTNIVPILYALLPNKNQRTYIRLFEIIKKLGFKIHHFKCDYEIAIMNAVKYVFQESNVSGCYYHYQRAVWKKAKELKVNRTSVERRIVRMAAILPLLPAQFIPQGRQLILEKMESIHTDTMQQFRNYYERQWFRLSPSMLSCANQRHRTTNSLEGWHHRLNVLIPQRPSLFYFIQKLRKEAQHCNTRITNSLFQNLRKNRRNRDIDFDKKYRKIVRKLQSGELTVENFLKKVIYIQLLI
uniref:FLYWCH-type domain-containing protein n=1 Tax=Pectinophora gossypiella TaxID=13191 RepID=A0A1E1WV05_PECGO